MVNKNLLLVFVVVMTMGVFNLADASECDESKSNPKLTAAVDMFLFDIETGLRGNPITEEKIKNSFADIVSAVRSELHENSK